MRRRAVFLFVLALAAFTLSSQPVSRSGIHPEDMDTTCKPCVDFWRYVNGGWLDKNPIPARMAGWGTFSVLGEANQERTRTILDAAAADTAGSPESGTRKMGDLFASCMDTSAIDQRGIMPLKSDFDRIAAIQSKKDLSAVIAAFPTCGHSRPFGDP